eukprot:2095328-Rhodomonas_salina.1
MHFSPLRHAPVQHRERVSLVFSAPRTALLALFQRQHDARAARDKQCRRRLQQRHCLLLQQVCVRHVVVQPRASALGSRFVLLASLSFIRV